MRKARRTSKTRVVKRTRPSTRRRGHGASVASSLLNQSRSAVAAAGRMTPVGTDPVEPAPAPDVAPRMPKGSSDPEDAEEKPARPRRRR